MHVGALCPESQSLKVVAFTVADPVEVYPKSPVVVPPESLFKGSKITGVANGLVPLSFTGFITGGGRTSTSNVDDPY